MVSRNFYGRGWPFPVRPMPNGGPPLVGGDDKIRQSIWLILSTAPGERVMRPDFGCGIHELVFQPNTSALRATVQEDVREALVQFEPRIDVLDVRAETPAEDAIRNQLIISVDYQVRQNNAQHNLVYPFFLSESAGKV